jgi:serine/threonine protein phosphatase PrpC
MAAEEFIARGLPMDTETEVNRQLAQLEKCIISRWGDEVYADFLERPYSDEEIAKLPPDWGFEDSVYSVYGTTLLITAVTGRYWFGLQIGDGKTVELTSGGEWREPVPWDDNCFLNATTSLCDENAADEFRHFFSETLPAAVFLCTDGVSESYRDESEFQNVLRGTGRVLALQTKPKARKVLSKFLPVISAGGNGDDVSIAAVYSKEKLAELDTIIL